MSAKMLTHLSVRELGGDPAVRFGGRILADLGASVAMAPDERGPATHPDWREWYFDDAKQAVAGDALDGYDIVLVGDRRWWTEAAHRVVTEVRDGRGPIVVALTSFGLSGPHSDFAAAPLTVFHGGGEGYLLPGGAEYRDRAPVAPSGLVAAYDTAVLGALAGVAAVIARRRTGRATLVEISGQECVASLNRTVLTQFTMNDLLQHRYSRGYKVGGIMPCADGWVTVMAAVQDRQWRDFVDLLGDPTLHADPRFVNRAGRDEHGAEINDRLRLLLSKWTRDDLTRECQARHVPVAAFLTLEEAISTPQMRFRGFLEPRPAPSGTVTMPGFPARFHTVADPAPDAGWRGAAAAGDRGPLTGVRVADFSWMLAGPYATMLLAMLGADVLKVESDRRRDPSRGMYPPRRLAGAGNTTLTAGLVAVNMNKRSVAVDLGRENGRALARAIALECDLVLDSYAPGVTSRLGLDHETLHAARPDLVCVSASTAGSRGPAAHFVGYAALFSALSGMGHTLGYADSPPGELRTGADLRAGAMTALAAVAALAHRAATGDGVAVDVSDVEVLMSAIADVAVRAQWPGEPSPIRNGNRDPSASQGCYPCRADDAWLSISLPDEEAWQRLARAAGDTGARWLADPRFADGDARRRYADDLDEAIAGWTRGRDLWPLTEQLQAAGVCAYPSLSTAGLIDSPHLRTRGAWVTLDHDVLGPVTVLGPPVLLDGQRPAVWRLAPELGADTHEILREVVHRAPDEIDALASEGVLT